MKNILIIEDNKELNYGLSKALKINECKIISCFNLKDGKEQILCQMPSLIILDLNLPDGNGLSLLQELKINPNCCPIIILTANDTDEDIVKGFEMGADDYITKPFSLTVLRARVNNQLKKVLNYNNKIVQIGPYSFDFSSLLFSVNGAAVELSKTEQKLLKVLIDNENCTVKREILIDKVWNEGEGFIDENALSVNIKRLRDKLKANNYIKTIYGIGYSWRTDNE